MFNPIPITIGDINNIPIIEGQLLYATDTLEAYFDISSINRIAIGCTIQVVSYYELENLPLKEKNKLYITLDDNRCYRYDCFTLTEIFTHLNILDIIVPATTLIPVTLKKNGKSVAPVTIAKEVYTCDGDNIENKIKNLIYKDRKSILYTKTEHVIAVLDGQKVFDIPFPIPNYDLNVHPMIVVHNDKIIQTNDITISKSQIILSTNLEGLAQGDILTFIFHYTVTVDCEGLNAESINNVRFYVGEHKPHNSRDTDVWFDTSSQSVKQFTDGEWRVIVKGSAVDDYPFYILKGTTTLEHDSTYVEIGIPGFNPNTDTLLVYLNSIYLEDFEDYTISSNSNHIISTGEIWKGSIEPVVFNFVVFKATNGETSKSTIIKSTDVITNVTDRFYVEGFDKNRDTLFLYENSIYLEEGENYKIHADGMIQNTMEYWDGTEDEVVLNSIVIKNTREHLNEESPNLNLLLKEQVFKTLGISESEFEYMKKQTGLGYGDDE